MTTLFKQTLDLSEHFARPEVRLRLRMRNRDVYSFAHDSNLSIDHDAKYRDPYAEVTESYDVFTLSVRTEHTPRHCTISKVGTFATFNEAVDAGLDYRIPDNIR